MINAIKQGLEGLVVKDVKVLIHEKELASSPGSPPHMCNDDLHLFFTGVQRSSLAIIACA